MLNPTNKQHVEEKIKALLGQMRLAEKIGQMTQVEINSITPDEVQKFSIGSILSGGGANPEPNNPQSWHNRVHAYLEPALKNRLSIPLLYGVDAVHGHSNVQGATIFPHNIGLGATRDEALLQKIGRITAVEVAATGVPWTFAPCAAVPQDIRWGRTYEGYSQNTAVVLRLSTALIRGLQDAGDGSGLRHPQAVMPSVKHFVGDGGTEWGTSTRAEWLKSDIWSKVDDRFSIDQGITAGDEAFLRAVHLPPYIAAIKAGALNIMISYSSWGGLKMHAQRYLLTDVLKEEFNFAGFLVSDWFAINQLNPEYYQCVVASINAGLDMIMVPWDYIEFMENLTQAVEQGDIPLSRIDDAVSRILRAKIELGLFEHPFAAEDTIDLVGCADHRAVAREAVAKSAVLLKNEQQTLPLDKHINHLLVAGQGADDIGLQCGGWTIAWMGEAGPITPGTTLLEGLKAAVADNTTITYSSDGQFAPQTKADVAIVVLSESPYAEGMGDRGDLTLTEEDLSLLARVRPLCRRLVVILYSGRPLIITDQLGNWDAFVAAWLPGSEANGISDLLFGARPFQGKLSYAWPRAMNQVPLLALQSSAQEPLFEYGFGLTS